MLATGLSNDISLVPSSLSFIQSLYLIIIVVVVMNYDHPRLFVFVFFFCFDAS